MKSDDIVRVSNLCSSSLSSPASALLQAFDPMFAPIPAHRFSTPSQSRRSAMRNSTTNSSLTEIRVLLTLLLIAVVAVPPAFAQENTSGDSLVPLVFSAENTGANYPLPVFPTFEQLPIVRPLPDAFRFFDGSRSTAFSSWERRRNEIKEIGRAHV